MRRRALPFRVRVSLWYVGLLAILIGGVSVVIYVELRSTLNESLDEDLSRRLGLVRASLTVRDGRPSLALATARAGDDPDEAFVRLLDVDGSLLASDSPAGEGTPVEAEALSAAAGGGSRRYTVAGPDQSYRVLASPVRDGDTVVGVLEVATSREDTDEALDRLLLILVIAAPSAVAVAAAGGMLIAGRALRPLRDITGMARRMSADALDERLAYAGPADELGELAATFNEMLERLDAAFRRQRQFTQDAAHELRTPLTAIQGQAEVALQRPRTPEEYADALHRVSEQTARLNDLVDGLLLLARADGGSLARSSEPVEVAELVEEARATWEAGAAAAGVALREERAAPASVRGERTLLLRLLGNLIENALRHTPAGREVVLGWDAEPTAVRLWVSDAGPGVPPAERARIFDRFQRLDEARSRPRGGAGLGLAICRAIAEAHGGRVWVEEAPGGGARFTVSLPAATRSS